MTIVDGMSSIVTASSAYRLKAKEDGFSDGAAELMAVAFHAELIKMAFKQAADL